MPGQSIELISFSTARVLHAVAGSLRALGYRPTAIDGGGRVGRGVGAASGDAVLVITPGADMPACDALRELHASLSVIAPEDDHWDDRLPAVARDFVVWPCHRRELALRLGARATEAPPAGLLNMVGQSARFRDTLALLQRVAPTEVAVLIEGETGTGKELAARAVHYLSPRKGGPFIPLNCGAIPEALVESELFGHVKGAFTGAGATRPGVIGLAEGGTLFLDEVDALSPRAQVSLLRFLQELEYRPVGGSAVKRADLRLVAATNTPLTRRVAAGEFREDLFYRLSLVPVILPPLRDRGDDVLVLARYFLDQFADRYGARFGLTLSRDAEDWLRSYRWPGNVRELDNVLHRAYLVADGVTIDATALRPVWSAEPLGGSADTADAFCQPFSDARREAVEGFERRYLNDVMSRAGGNVSEAARLAGKERRALGKLLKKHGIDRRHFA